MCRYHTIALPRHGTGRCQAPIGKSPSQQGNQNRSRARYGMGIIPVGGGGEETKRALLGSVDSMDGGIVFSVAFVSNPCIVLYPL